MVVCVYVHEYLSVYVCSYAGLRVGLSVARCTQLSDLFVTHFEHGKQ